MKNFNNVISGLIITAAIILIINACSAVKTAIPCPGTPTVNYAGKFYNTILIGDMCWLKENLEAGVMIDSAKDASNNGVIEKYCYHNQTENCTIYGGLYQWKEAMQYSTTLGAKGICPEGWHIPTIREFDTLMELVDSSSNALKETGQGTEFGAGTNESGFSALLAGYRSNNGYFADLNSYSYFWSSTEYNTLTVYCPLLLDYSDEINYFDDNKYYGFSVRCVKN